MKPSIKILLSTLLILLLSILIIAFHKKSSENEILSYQVNPKTQDLAFYWKNDQGEIINTIGNLKKQVEANNQTLVFAMNGGMFDKNYNPHGLYIQDHKTLVALDTTNGEGNFYLKPNGVFYITNNSTPVICKTTDFIDNGNIKYATQSGPMLVIDGKIHPAFKENSTNLNIRNGVGILPDNEIVFAISKKKITFYEFAKYFQDLGCKSTLYLDGYVSKMYFPEKEWMNSDGNFGVIIGVTKSKD